MCAGPTDTKTGPKGCGCCSGARQPRRLCVASFKSRYCFKREKPAGDKKDATLLVDILAFGTRSGVELPWDWNLYYPTKQIIIIGFSSQSVEKNETI